MNQNTNILFNKIQELSGYLNKHSSKSSNIQNFLKDLKSIEPNLSILAILNNLVQMYRNGLAEKDIINDIKKTKRIFLIVSEYIKFLEEDKQVKSLSKEIHKIILGNLEKALKLFLKEFSIK